MRCSYRQATRNTCAFPKNTWRATVKVELKWSIFFRFLKISPAITRIAGQRVIRSSISFRFDYAFITFFCIFSQQADSQTIRFLVEFLPCITSYFYGTCCNSAEEIEEVVIPPAVYSGIIWNEFGSIHRRRVTSNMRYFDCFYRTRMKFIS